MAKTPFYIPIPSTIAQLWPEGTAYWRSPNGHHEIGTFRNCAGRLSIYHTYGLRSQVIIIYSHYRHGYEHQPPKYVHEAITRLREQVWPDND